MRLGFIVLAATCWVGWAQAAEPPVPGVVQSAGPFEIEAPTMEPAGLSCPAPGNVTVGDASFVHVRKVLQPGDRLDILAVGSATVMGPDPAHPDNGFPYRMAQAVKLAEPLTTVTLTLRGGKGLTAAAMRDAMAAAVASHVYQLVLWQTGTVEALRGMPPGVLYDTIVQGAGLLKDESDLILIDSQFSRFLQANAGLEPYQKVLDQAGELPGVALFHRFELMRIWADTGVMDLERAVPAERQATAEHLHVCLGRSLARMVLAGAGLHAAR